MTLLAQLADCAKARRVTKSALVREGLRGVLYEHPTARPPSCYDLAVDLAVNRRTPDIPQSFP